MSFRVNISTWIPEEPETCGEAGKRSDILGRGFLDLQTDRPNNG